MDDDLDILGSLDDLDSNILGRKIGGNKKPTTSALDSLFGESSKKSTGSASAPKKSTVSFLDDVDVKQEKKPFNLDDLFNESVPPPKTTTPSGSSSLFDRPSTSNPRPSSTTSTTTPSARPQRSYGFGRQETKTELVAPPPAPTPTVATPTVDSDASAGRAARLESEIERLNREIVDIRRQKKEDEDSIIREWKEKLSSKESEYTEELERTKSNHVKQMEKLKNESEDELARMKETYSRQLEAMQSTLGHSRDVTGMVDKVDELTETIKRIAGDVSTVTEQRLMERESGLSVRADQLNLREDTLERDRLRLEEEKKVVYELNTRLRDLVKEQEKTLEEEKWKAKEEWNRLTAEKDAFRQDQKFVLERLEKQKAELEMAKTNFLREQHDLLVRVSNERVTLDADKTDFYAQRNVDLKRIREEAIQLQTRSRNIQVADAHVEELKRFYYTKFKQLQELESSLMEECIELERIRGNLMSEPSNEYKGAIQKGKNTSSKNNKLWKNIQIMSKEQLSSESSPESMIERNDSVRAVLKKHSEFLKQFSGDGEEVVNNPQYSSQMYRDL